MRYGTIIVISAVVTVVLFVCILWAIPQYKVYYAGLAGEAMLRKAESEKKILIEQARAEVESAKLRAEAITIVGKATKDYPEYRLQEFIGAFAEALKEGNIDQIIYIPTEANIPILEAKR